jgi:hypothetical protein
LRLSATHDHHPAGHHRDGEYDVATIPMRFEVTTLPVADADRAKAFYQRLRLLQEVTERIPRGA